MPGRLPYDLDAVEEWSRTQKSKSASPLPNQTYADFRIVIAFQDTEAFPSSVIAEFISRYHSRLCRLPVILFFGVASTLDQFQQNLPPSIIQSLSPRIFQVRQNDECLNIIIDKVVSFVSPFLARVDVGVDV
jgi:origin recognition complex subunit 3